MNYNVLFYINLDQKMSKNNLPNVLNSKTPKVYKKNNLNNANFGDFTHNDYQVFLYLVSKVGGVDKEGKYLQPDTLKREHSLTAREFSQVFNTDIDNSYRYLKKAIDKLMRTDIRIQNLESENITRINICSRAEYKKREGCIVVKFTDDVMPYLAQVRQKFVLYNLKEIANFDSFYTTRLYELIQEFKDTGYMIKSVEQLREIFAVGTKFKLYKDLKRRTFDHACQEINNNYAMNLGYEEIKEGRKVVAIKFVFKKTRIHKVTNQRTGVEKNVYIKPKQRTKKHNSTPSTDILLERPMSFDKVKDEPKSIQSVALKILSKLKP